mmetsp:Transcript_2927/g.7689  ORF Transcript_2927/g.7689 Transcript_2927/m.7689 type:complete len:252 (+) Transcript_2927:928-1683(+)
MCTAPISSSRRGRQRWRWVLRRSDWSSSRSTRRPRVSSASAAGVAGTCSCTTLTRTLSRSSSSLRAPSCARVCRARRSRRSWCARRCVVTNRTSCMPPRQERSRRPSARRRSCWSTGSTPSTVSRATTRRAACTHTPPYACPIEPGRRQRSVASASMCSMRSRCSRRRACAWCQRRALARLQVVLASAPHSCRLQGTSRWQSSSSAATTKYFARSMATEPAARRSRDMAPWRSDHDSYHCRVGRQSHSDRS